MVSQLLNPQSGQVSTDCKTVSLNGLSLPNRSDDDHGWGWASQAESPLGEAQQRSCCEVGSEDAAGDRRVRSLDSGRVQFLADRDHGVRSDKPSAAHETSCHMLDIGVASFD